MELRLIDVLLVVYALSLVFYFSDFIGRLRKAKHWGIGLLLFVWVLLSYYLFDNYVAAQSLMNLATAEYLLLLSWLLMCISLILTMMERFKFLIFFNHSIGFLLLLLNQLHLNDVRELQSQMNVLEGYFLAGHILFIILAFAGFTISLLLAVVYLIVHTQLRAKRWTPFIRKLPSLGALERNMVIVVLVSVLVTIVSFLFAGIALGISGEWEQVVDYKFGSSFLIGIYFTVILIRKQWYFMKATTFAKLVMLGYAFLLVNMGINNISEHHNFFYIGSFGE